MSSAGGNEGGAGGAQYLFRTPNDTPDRKLFDEVLNWTIEQARAGAHEPVDLEPFLAVARQYPNLTLADEPVAVELASVAIEPYRARSAAPPESWREIATRIAQTLLDDPVAEGRLRKFWDRLREQTR